MRKGGYNGGGTIVRVSPLLHGRDALSSKRSGGYSGPQRDVREKIRKDILKKLKTKNPTIHILRRLAQKAQDFYLHIPEISMVAEAHGITGYEPQSKLIYGKIRKDGAPPSADELAVARAEALLASGKGRGKRRKRRAPAKPGARVFIAEPNWQKPKNDR